MILPFPMARGLMVAAAAVLALAGARAVAAPWAGPAQSLCAVPAPAGVQVIRKFCDGPALLILTLNGKTHMYRRTSTREPRVTSARRSLV